MFTNTKIMKNNLSFYSAGKLNFYFLLSLRMNNTHPKIKGLFFQKIGFLFFKAHFFEFLSK